MDRLTRAASAALCEAVQAAVHDVIANGGFSDDWDVAVAARIEEVLGPYHREQVGQFGERFTRLQAEPDGYHEFVILYL